MPVYMRSCILVAGIDVPLLVPSATLGALAFTKTGFRNRKLALLAIPFAMLLPIHVALIPLTIMLSRSQLIDMFASLIMVYLGFSVSSRILLARGYRSFVMPIAPPNAQRL
jgi:raffinose/stachyose/melibiose transport system permease protein